MEDLECSELNLIAKDMWIKMPELSNVDKGYVVTMMMVEALALEKNMNLQNARFLLNILIPNILALLQQKGFE